MLDKDWKHKQMGKGLLRPFGARVMNAQQCRRPDGVRGLFTSCSRPANDVVAIVPLRSAFFGGSDLASTYSPPHLPEYRKILLQLDDARVQLEVSRSGGFGSLRFKNSRVLSVALRPFESALVLLAVDHHLRQKYLAPSTRRNAEGGGDALAHYLHTLPLDVACSRGAESTFLSVAMDDARFDLHSCVEQLAKNLADAYLANADDNIYRLHDATPELVESTVLGAVYLIVSRVLVLPPPSSDEGLNPPRIRTPSSTESLEAVVPFIDMLNHAAKGAASCRLFLSSGRRPQDRELVVRTVRPMRFGEELTIDYAPCSPFCTATNPETAMELRYQMSFQPQLVKDEVEAIEEFSDD